MKYLPCSSSFGGIVKTTRLFHVSSLEDNALVDTIAESGSVLRRIKVFPLRARKLRKELK